MLERNKIMNNKDAMKKVIEAFDAYDAKLDHVKANEGRKDKISKIQNAFDLAKKQVEEVMERERKEKEVKPKFSFRTLIDKIMGSKH